MQADVADIDRLQADAADDGCLPAQPSEGVSGAAAAVQRAAVALCKAAGHTLLRLRTSAPQSMRKISAAAADRRTCCWRILTSGGLHHAFFYQEVGLFGSKFRAALWLQDAPQAAAVVALSRADYEEILSMTSCTRVTMH